MHFIDATLAKSVTNMFLIAQKKQLMVMIISIIIIVILEIFVCTKLLI